MSTTSTLIEANAAFERDLSELAAVKSALGAGTGVAISATKSMTGHMLGATGAVEAIATVLALSPLPANDHQPDER